MPRSLTTLLVLNNWAQIGIQSVKDFLKDGLVLTVPRLARIGSAYIQMYQVI